MNSLTTAELGNGTCRNNKLFLHIFVLIRTFNGHEGLLRWLPKTKNVCFVEGSKRYASKAFEEKCRKHLHGNSQKKNNKIINDTQTHDFLTLQDGKKFE